MNSVEAFRSYYEKNYHLWRALFIALAIIATLQWLTGKDDSTDDLQTADNSRLEQATLAPVPEVDSTLVLSDNLKKLAEQQNYKTLRTELLDDAMLAVEKQNDQALANALTLLGIAALDESDTDTAIDYLEEALSLYEELGDELEVANVSMQIARSHIVERRRARRAALAYDNSLIARWKIAYGRFQEAEQPLRNAIAENISLNRNGAAAVDYETLYRGYLQNGDIRSATDAALEAARLHADSGRRDVAQNLVNQLSELSLTTGQLDSIQTELDGLQENYLHSVSELGRARDYQQLYNHFIFEGDPVRAWRFRLKANASEQKASKRARYRRQSGVLVLLYNSNDNMRQAKASLQRARQGFLASNQHTLADQTHVLMSEVY